MTPPAELTVDPIACTGRGVCAELLPELIDLDDWGYPRVAPGPPPPHLRSSARRAVSACPTLALALRPVPEPRGGRSPSNAVTRLWNRSPSSRPAHRPGGSLPEGGAR